MLTKKDAVPLIITLAIGVSILALIIKMRTKRQQAMANKYTSSSSLWQTSKEKLIEIQDTDIDLFAGQSIIEKSSLNNERMDARYNSVIPYNAVSQAGGYVQIFRKQLNVSRLSKTHIINILSNNYLSENNQQDVQDIVRLEDVIRPIEKNVCALSHSIGQPFGTALLIAPNLILTARHCIENLPIKSLLARFGYQIESWGMNYGENIDVIGVVEENAEFDYSILQLSRSVTDFQSIHFNLIDRLLGNSIFIHHPDGGPKKVSVHANLESEYQQLSHSSFHDSWQASSGGTYVDEESRIFALHLLFGNQTTGARWIKDIYNSSHILQNLFDKNGQYKNITLSNKLELRLFLPISQFSKDYRDVLEKKLEKVNFDMPKLPKLFGVDQSRHHIVPDGDMQFLWMLGQELPNKLGKLLTKMAYQYDPYTSTINAIEWAPWNIFIGPAGEHRLDDPEKIKKGGRIPEQTCPPSFNSNLWALLQELHSLIRKCWDARYELSKQLNYIERTNTMGQYREGQMQLYFNKYDGRSEIDIKDNLLKQSVKPEKEKYIKNLNELVACLTKIERRYKYLRGKEHDFNDMHQTIKQDWELHDIKNEIKFSVVGYNPPSLSYINKL